MALPLRLSTSTKPEALTYTEWAKPIWDADFDEHALSSKLWRLNNLYRIIDKDGRNIRFIMKEEMLRMYFEGHWFNVLCKARQYGYCLDPSTRVLTADLRWEPIDELGPGDEIVAVDEYPAERGRGNSRKMRTGVVEARGEVVRTAYRITFDDGRSVICTGQHPWFSKKAASTTDWRTIEAKTKKKLRVGTWMRWITKPWDEPTVEDGWFGGMLDGEGSIATAMNTSPSVGVAQVKGPVWDRMLKYCEDRGYNHCIEHDDNYRPNKFGTQPCPKISIGRMDEMFKLIGQTRPTRFIGNRFWEGRTLPGRRNGGVGWSRIVDIQPLGERVMADLQTSTGTYIAEGFVSHNTTYFAIDQLDDALFTSDIRCQLSAHKLEDAQSIFRDKVRFPYDQIGVFGDDDVPHAGLTRGEWQSVRDTVYRGASKTSESAEQLFFSNNSSIRVTVSGRSATLQRLHVSELGKIAAQNPQKAVEIKTGSFPAAKRGVVWVESTAEGEEGLFYDLVKDAERLEQAGTKLVRGQPKLFFHPWWRDAEYALDLDEALRVVIPSRLVKYFKDLEAKSIHLTRQQQAWYVVEEAVQGEFMWREYPSTVEEAFQASAEGTYFSTQMAKVRREGRICDLPVVDGIPVDTWWDIGMDDYTSIIFTQTVDAWTHHIDFYENSGEGLPHYLTVLAEKQDEYGWRFGRHWGPPDLANRDWSGDGRKRWEVAEQHGFRFDIARKCEDKAEWIEAARMHLSRCKFHEVYASELVRHLDNYRKEWDQPRGVWKKTPRHDEHSHAADAFQLEGVEWQSARNLRPMARKVRRKRF